MNRIFSLTITIILAISIIGCSNTPLEGKSATLNKEGLIDKDSSYIKLVHYGTSRTDNCKNTSCNDDPSRLNSGNSNSESHITYGIVKVRIPYSKKIGGTSGMSPLSIQHNIPWNDFISKLTNDDLLIFIHGFNTSFTNGAKRSAQLAHDTNFKGKVVFYSWPSSENPVSYSTDKKRAQENFGMLADFLQNISEKTNKNIHIIAHSMGTYLLMNSLSIIKNRINQNDILLSKRRKENNGKIFSQIILAAPDINKDDYYKNFFAHEISNIADKFTLYSHKNDNVLKASRIVNYFVEGSNQTRLGDSSANFFVIEGMDTVDTREEIPHQFFGHSFYANYRALISDIYLLLNYGTAPDNRMLQKVTDNSGKSLWFIRD
ncbi:alpha/beta hydrolase [Pseudoteredinibacter isoporae]|uniref:alpha/beta hydrolase n=1 Tax=Pseudoteredinibacter isoporae TaxID=570281 RepID=UPI00310220F1